MKKDEVRWTKWNAKWEKDKGKFNDWENDKTQLKKWKRKLEDTLVKFQKEEAKVNTHIRINSKFKKCKEVIWKPMLNKPKIERKGVKLNSKSKTN